MSVLVDIRAALETRLAALASVLPTVHENEGYDPIIDTPYQQVALLPGETQNPTIGAAGYHVARETGVFQVNVFYPRGKGPGGAAAKAEAIRDHFTRGLSLVAGTVTVSIDRTPSIGPALTQGDWYMVPVRVFYLVNRLG